MHVTVIRPFAAYRVGDQISDAQFLNTVLNNPSLLQYVRIDPDQNDTITATQTKFVNLIGQAIINQVSSLSITAAQILSAIAGYLTNAGYPVSVGSGSATLSGLTLSALVETVGSAFFATILGSTLGSTIAATSSDGTTLAVSGSTVSGTFSVAGSKTITFVETLAGATGSPKTSTATITVSAAAATTNNLHSSFFAFSLLGAATN